MSTQRRGAPIPLLMPTRRAACVFVLPELLPARTQVLLDVHSCTAILLNQESEGATPLLHFCPLTPSAARVFRLIASLSAALLLWRVVLRFVPRRP